MPDHTDTIAKLRQMMRVSTRLRQDQMRDVLGLTPAEFNQKIFDWADEFGFTIEGDFISFSATGATDFIAELEREFAKWGSPGGKTTGKQTGGIDPHRKGPAAPTNIPSLGRLFEDSVPDHDAGTPKNYNGITLAAPDYAVMLELESKCQQPIPPVPVVGSNTFGFSSHEGRVTGLGLANRGLASLPWGIVELSALKKLALQDNHLHLLPDSFGDLSNLQELRLTGNQLRFLPASMGNLTSLERLDLDGNQFPALPAFLVDLPALESIAIDGTLTKDRTVKRLKKKRLVQVVFNFNL